MKEIIKILKYKRFISSCFGIEDVRIEIRKRPKKHEKYNGFHRNKDKLIVLYKSEDMLSTLFHELTHAYQHRYLHMIMEDEEFYRSTNIDNYWNRPMEQHARIVAKTLGMFINKYGIDALNEVSVKNIILNSLDKIVR